jgi:uncharacterized OB-fold protein
MVYSEENYKNAKSSDVFEFVCKKCGEIFFKTKREISKNKGNIPVFCSQDCQKQFYKDDCYVIVKCENCGKEKRILKGEYNKSETKKFFCNHSCSAEFNNKNRVIETDIIWKYNGNTKKGYNKCPICGELKYYTSKLCKKCSDKEKTLIKERTLGSYIDGKQYLTSKCGEIRRDARKTLENSKVEKVCAYCKNHEFDDILEAHHVKGILEFDSKTTINEINSISNLVWLCPNHHIMLEKGLIKLSNDMINSNSDDY